VGQPEVTRVPDGVTIEPASPDDLPEVLALLAAAKAMMLWTIQ
jgi:hypothetical protein